jgi:hypothetical protein
MTMLVLAQALEPVMRDIQSSGVPVPEVRDEDWAGDPRTEVAFLRSQDGSMSGVAVDVDASEVDQIVSVTDQVQDWVIEELNRTDATNWPRCPNHPHTHPLRCVSLGGVALWVCPTDGMPFRPVGSLF